MAYNGPFVPRVKAVDGYILGRSMSRNTSEDTITRNFTIARQVIAWLIGVLLAYGAISTRVAVTESKVSTIQDDLREIKADIKQLLQRK